jgi:GNAT superfamily N-acetyltransferase
MTVNDSGDDERPFTIRRLAPTDRAGWQPLWDAYLRFYRATVADSVSDATFARLCDDGSGLVGLVVVDPADRICGLSHLVFHPSTWTATPSCYLQDLFVDGGARGSGVTTQLFDAIYATARDHGSTRVYWHTQQFNGPARSLYDRVGRLTSFVVYNHDV